MANRNFYVLCDDNCRFPSMTKDEIFTAIQSAVEQHGTRTLTIDVLTGLKEVNKNEVISLWIGTQAEFNAIQSPSENTMYLISDHNAIKAQTMAALQEMFTRIEELTANIESETASLNALQNQITAIQQAVRTCRSRIDEEINIAQILSKMDEIETVLPEIHAEEWAYCTERDAVTQLWSGSQVLNVNATFSGIMANVSENCEIYIDCSMTNAGISTHTFVILSGSPKAQLVYLKVWGANRLRSFEAWKNGNDLVLHDSTQNRDITIHRIFKLGV